MPSTIGDKLRALAEVPSYYFENLTFFSKYPSVQLEYVAGFQFEHEKVFRKLCELFQIEEGKPKIQPEFVAKTTVALSVDFVEHCAFPHVLDILSMLKHYEFTRDRKKKMLADARGLLVLFLAQYAQLCLGDMNSELLTTVVKGQKFVSNLIRNSSARDSPLLAESDGLYTLLENVQSSFSLIEQIIQCKLEEQTIGDNLESLVNCGRVAIDTLFVAIPRALSSVEVPLHSFYAFHSPEATKRLDKWGGPIQQLLLRLGRHPSLQRIMGVETEVALPKFEFAQEVNGLLDGQDSSQKLLSALFSDSRTVNVFVPLEKEMLMELLKAHGYLVVLSDLLLCCKDLIYSVRMAGEIIIGGSSLGEELIQFVCNGITESLSMLQHAMKTTLGATAAPAEAVIKSASPPLDRKTWINNRQEFVAKVGQFEEKAREMSELCSRIKSKTHLDNALARVQQCEKRLQRMMRGMLQVYTRVGWLQTDRDSVVALCSRHLQIQGAGGGEGLVPSLGGPQGSSRLVGPPPTATSFFDGSFSSPRNLTMGARDTSQADNATDEPFLPLDPQSFGSDLHCVTAVNDSATWLAVAFIDRSDSALENPRIRLFPGAIDIEIDTSEDEYGEGEEEGTKPSSKRFQLLQWMGGHTLLGWDGQTLYCWSVKRIRRHTFQQVRDPSSTPGGEEVQIEQQMELSCAPIWPLTKFTSFLPARNRTQRSCLSIGLTPWLWVSPL